MGYGSYDNRGSAIPAISFNEGDAARLSAAISSVSANYEVDLPEAVKIGMLTTLKSLQASTRVSKSHRTLKVANKAGYNKRDMNRMNRFQVVYDFPAKVKNLEQPIYVYGDTKEQAKKNYPRTKLYWSGTAKASWGWIAKKIYQTSELERSGGKHTRRTAVYGFANYKDGVAQAVAVNKLDYIQSAFFGGESARKPAADTALARAAILLESRVQNLHKINARKAGFRL